MRIVFLARKLPTGPPLHTYKYYQIIRTVWELWSAQDFSFSEENYITKKVRIVSFASDTHTGPPLHSYQILPKYVLGYQSYGAHKDVSTMSA